MQRKLWAVLCIALLTGCAGKAPAASAAPEASKTPEAPAVSATPETPKELLSGMEDPYAYMTDVICRDVPRMYEFLQNGTLQYGEERKYAVNELGTNDQECYGVSFGYEDGSQFVTVRSFAMANDQSKLYEYQDVKGYWYEREAPHPTVTLDRLRSDMAYNGYIGGFAYVGSDGIDKKYRQMFPWLEGLETVEYDGADLFAIVPADPAATVAVNRTDGNNNVTEVLYRSENGDPILLKAGSSTRMPDVQISITDSQGRTLSFSVYYMPMFDIYDPAHGIFAGNFGIVDYLWTVEDDELIQQKIVQEFPDLEDLLKKGMVMDKGPHDRIELSGHPCFEVYFGTEHDGMFTREKTYAVSDDMAHIFEYDVVSDSWYEYYQ